MAYVNKLNLLTEKAAEMDTLNILRDLKRNLTLPITVETLQNQFKQFNIAEEDIQIIQTAELTAGETITNLKALAEFEDPDFEKINVIRTINLLAETPGPFENNIAYVKQMKSYETEFIKQLNDIISKFVNRREVDERQLRDVHRMLLRNDQLRFRYEDLIHEGHVDFLDGLSKNMSKGYLFHITLEEELKKISNFRNRIAPNKIEISDDVERRIGLIKNGVTKAYQINMNMIQKFLLHYTFIKWLATK